MLIPYRRRLIRKWLLLSIPLFLLFILLFTFTFDRSPIGTINTEATPKEVVEQFYQYEQTGNFVGSWNLFHSQLKERFNKSDYIQKRARAFMQDFGVKSFAYTIGEPRVITSWKMSPKAPQLPEVIQIPITMIYNSEFGNFVINQDVFLAKEKNQYKILWQFSREN